MAKSLPLDGTMISIGTPRGAAAASPSLVPGRVEAPAAAQTPDVEGDKAASLFARKRAAEARTGLTIRILVSDAERLDNLARRTGHKKQDILDQAIRNLLDEADRAGNLTAPI